MKPGICKTILVYLLTIPWATCLHAYDIQINNSPVLDPGPNTSMAKHSPREGESLITWLGGAESIEKIVIVAPYINMNQVDFTEEYVQNRIKNSVCINSQIGAWHYAPFTMGVIYFSNGDQISFTMFLSGITIEGNLFG